MERTVELKFEAEVTEASKNVLRFRRTDLDWGVVKKFFFENFGKLVTTHLDLRKFEPKQKIIVTIKNSLVAATNFEENKNSITIRAVVNEKFSTGMSFRLPQTSSDRFFKKAFTTDECAELTESTLLLENQNPYEIGDIVEVSIQKGGLTRKSPLIYSLKAQLKRKKAKAAIMNKKDVLTANE